MLSRITTVIEQVVESALSVVGLRWGIEEPRYSSESLGGGVQIRHYGPRIAAETTVEGEERAARNEGFRRLAGYIFGANEDNQSIKMTAPVSRQSDTGQKIDMTAPVVQLRRSQSWVIRFFMPATWTMQTLPTPHDARVVLTEIPGETVAVLRFSGDRSARAVTAATDRLLEALRTRNVKTTGEPAAWFYDPPWTLPFRRRTKSSFPSRTDSPDDAVAGYGGRGDARTSGPMNYFRPPEQPYGVQPQSSPIPRRPPRNPRAGMPRPTNYTRPG